MPSPPDRPRFRAALTDRAGFVPAARVRPSRAAALALLIAAATPAIAQNGARPDDLCATVPAAAAKVLLFDGAGGTLDSWGGRTGPGHRTCRWEARRHGKGEVGVMTLTVDTYSDPSAAQAAMGEDTMQASGQSDALPRGSADRLASSDPFVVQARHGALLATVDAMDAALSAPPWAERY